METNPTSVHEDSGSGSGIWHCCELWRRSQTWLGSHVAMAVLWMYSFLKKNIYIFLLFRTVSVAYGGSQARGQIRVAAAGLRHSPSKVGSEPRL